LTGGGVHDSVLSKTRRMVVNPRARIGRERSGDVEDTVDAITISPAASVEAEIDLPGSKSYSNRALLLAALGEGRSELTRALFSDDTRYMHQALTQLGTRIRADQHLRRYEVEGCGGAFPSRGAALSVGNAGTAARFLTAALAIGEGVFSVDGSPRMRERPIEPLLDALRQLGVDASARLANGRPPVDIRAGGIPGDVHACRGTSRASS